MTKKNTPVKATPENMAKKAEELSEGWIKAGKKPKRKHNSYFEEKKLERNISNNFQGLRKLLIKIAITVVIADITIMTLLVYFNLPNG